MLHRKGAVINRVNQYRGRRFLDRVVVLNFRESELAGENNRKLMETCSREIQNKRAERIRQGKTQVTVLFT